MTVHQPVDARNPHYRLKSLDSLCIDGFTNYYTRHSAATHGGGNTLCTAWLSRSLNERKLLRDSIWVLVISDPRLVHRATRASSSRIDQRAVREAVHCHHVRAQRTCLPDAEQIGLDY